jgi:hypothetical protein
MPSTTYENTVTGVGSDALGGGRVYYVAWEVTVLGARARQPTESDTEHLNGVGFLALGNDLTSLGLISGVGWGPEMWMNWRTGQFVVTPTVIGTEFPAIFADHIRWSVGVGTTVHFYVFGDA